MNDYTKTLALNPWQPITDPVDLKHLGKLGEEANELGSAACRCMIQGIDEREPVTGKLNREWLEDEIADVWANIRLNIERFGLDTVRIKARRMMKEAHLRAWHAMPGSRPEPKIDAALVERLTFMSSEEQQAELDKMFAAMDALVAPIPMDDPPKPNSLMFPTDLNRIR